MRYVISGILTGTTTFLLTSALKLTMEKNTYYEKRGKYKALINWKLLCAISAKGDGVFGVL
jgi:hypothetical protein